MKSMTMAYDGYERGYRGVRAASRLSALVSFAAPVKVGSTQHDILECIQCSAGFVNATVAKDLSDKGMSISIQP